MPNQTCCPTSAGMGCVDPLFDNRNCGQCGAACGVGQSCQLGLCAQQTGDVGRPDGGSPDACNMGMCGPPCLPGFMCCGTTWVLTAGIMSGDARNDASFRNCHTCGTSCDAMRATRCGLPPGTTTGAPQCMCGNSVMCLNTETCLADPPTSTTYGCFNLQTDPTHCGTTPVACAAGEACVAGACTCMAAGMRCPTGQTCGTTGCIDTTSDPMNCGTIGHACRTGETCAAGMCHCGSGAPCPGRGAMPGSCGQLCCAGSCVYASDANCAVCGTACAGALVCGAPFFGGPVRCGDTSVGAFIQCNPPPPPMDSGVPDAGVDANVDANVDAGTDANVDAV